MKCLLCQEDLDQHLDVRRLLVPDLLCRDCRNAWQKKRFHFRLAGIRVDTDYVYQQAFARCLLQFKECGDEALKDVFLHENLAQLKWRYRGYVILLMPSQPETRERRGFSHLALMYECLQLPMLEPFEKCTAEEQKTQNRQGRLAMAHGIRLKPGICLPQKLLLADDVITTGSTLTGALNCLDRQKHIIRIYAVASHARWHEKKKRLSAG